MTNTSRVILRESHVPAPPGFHNILEIELPASINVGNRIVIHPNQPRDIRSRISTRFSLDESVVTALRRISRGPFVFDMDPSVDPLERIATPGAGVEFVEFLLNQEKVENNDEKAYLGKLLREGVLPAHESFGHVRINLDPQQIALETELIWQTICQCLAEPNMGKFLDYPDMWDPGWLAQFYLNEHIHELYALLQEENVWKQFEEESRFRDVTSRLKTSIRDMQDETAVNLLRLVLAKSNNDVPKVLKLIHTSVTENNLGLSHSTIGLLHDLSKGIEIDKLTDVASLGAVGATFGLSIEEVERWQDQQKEARAQHLKDPVVRAMLSTYMALDYEDSSFRITFYSTENTEEAIRRIPTIDVVREARRILVAEGKPYPLYPMQSLGKMMGESVQMIADGVFSDEALEKKGQQIDVVKEFRAFYLAWRPALVKALEHRS